MFPALISSLQTPLLAEALITWTPLTFYVAMAIVQVVVILAGFKLLQVDSENNPIASALVVAGAALAAGYLTREMGLVGLMITSATIFGLLVATTAGDAVRSLVLAGVCIATYAGMGHFLVPRTPLTATTVGGFAQAFMVGLEEDAIAGEEDLYEHTKKKTDKVLSE